MLLTILFFIQSNSGAVSIVAKYGVGTATINQINGTKSGSIIYSKETLITKNILKIKTIIVIKVSAFISGFIAIID